MPVNLLRRRSKRQTAVLRPRLMRTHYHFIVKEKDLQMLIKKGKVRVNILCLNC